MLIVSACVGKIIICKCNNKNNMKIKYKLIIILFKFIYHKRLNNKKLGIKLSQTLFNGRPIF